MEDITIGNDVTMRQSASDALAVIDQFEILRKLGGGGFGSVYLARDTVADVEVAVKGLPPIVRNNTEELERIRSNFALVSRLHHPYIAAALHLHRVQLADYRVNGVYEELNVGPGDTLMVMEYAPGVTLSQWRKQFPGGIVPFDKAVAIVRQLAEALDYAHSKRILHRDIKPSNIMIETSPEGEVAARLLDFGLAAEIKSSMGRVSREIHDMSGTRPYMAPEQWAGEKQGPATDQYALAVVFCELVTGEVPFASVFECGDPVVMMTAVCNRAAKLPNNCPFAGALLKALAKQPDARFDSCSDFVARLSCKPVVPNASVRPSSRPKRIQPRPMPMENTRETRFVWATIAAVVAVLMLAGSVLFVVRRRSMPQPVAVAPVPVRFVPLPNDAEVQTNRAMLVRVPVDVVARDVDKVASERAQIDEAKALDAARERANVAAAKMEAMAREARKAKADVLAREKLDDAVKLVRRARDSFAALKFDEAAKWHTEACDKFQEAIATAKERKRALDAGAAAKARAKELSSTSAVLTRQSISAESQAGDTALPLAQHATFVGSRTFMLPNEIPVEMVWCGPGAFNYVRGQTTVSCEMSGFWIARYELTQRQWMSVSAANPSEFVNDELPVENLSWNDAARFVIRLNALTGRRFRLPTSREWEYAARGGPKGDRDMSPDECAWWGRNSGDRTHRGGGKKPNALGLYDVLGNVWEWCMDVGTGENSGKGELRGGSFCNNNPKWISTTTRMFSDQDCAGRGAGLRIVCDSL